MKFAKLKKAAAVVVVFATAASANAAGLTDAITEAATQAKTDIGAGGAIIIGVMVAIAAVSWVRRVIK